MFILLAYSAVVLSTGHELHPETGRPVPADEKLTRIGFQTGSGPIAMAAMSSKQLKNLEEWFLLFRRAFPEV